MNDSHWHEGPASFILPRSYYDASGLDGETETWSESVARKLEQAIFSCKDSQFFERSLVAKMSAHSREVGLLAVELLALALLPIIDVREREVELFRTLAASVPGSRIELPKALLAGIESTGFRAARPEDNLVQRLLWLTRYVQARGKCPEYTHIENDGYADYLDHADIHESCPYEWLFESPWVSASFSATVPETDPGMRYDFDHMCWPKYLPPFDVRHEGDAVRRNVQGLLLELGGEWEQAALKDLYLAKQLIGSWDDMGAARFAEWRLE